MNIQRIVDDFNYTTNQTQTDNYSQFYDIETYFGNNTSSYTTLANNHGAVAAKEYINYVTDLYFPVDGSWIGVNTKSKDPEIQQKALEALKYLNKSLIDAKFYREITKFARSGVLHNKGIIETSYANCLTFTNIDPDEIFISKESHDGARRAYSVVWKTAEEIMEEFDGELPSELRSRDLRPEERHMHYKVIVCTLPISKHFGIKSRKRYKYLKMYLCESEFGVTELTHKKEDGMGYYSFPLSQFLGYCEDSLAALSLPVAVRLNNYEQLIGSKGRQQIRPPHAVGLQTYKNNNNISFEEDAVVPIFPGEIVPTPIATTGAFNITDRDIIRLEQKIDRNFMIPLIQRLQVTNVSQFEAALNEIGAIKAIAPNCSDLSNVAVEVVQRSHDLLMKNDKKYKQMSKGLEMEFMFAGLAGKLNKLKKAVGIARTVQAVAPLFQIDPTLRDIVHGEQTFINAVDCYDVPFMAKSEDEVEQARQQREQQVQQQEQMEQATASADVQQKLAQAQRS